MTRFLFRLGDARGPFMACLLVAAVSGCLPSIAPKEAAVTGEPSEVDVLRADNAELSRRVHELRAEKAELKRRLALLELEVTTPGEQAPEDKASGTPDGGVSVAQAGAAAAAADQAPAAAQASAEESLLLSGSADATDFDLGRAALEAGSYQNADVTLSRFLS